MMYMQPPRRELRWKEEMIAAVRRLITTEGRSRAEAAASLEVEFPGLRFTKNMLIGACYRRGIAPRNLRVKKMAPTRNPFPAKNCCVFPHGDPRHEEFHFCGNPIARVGLPYCATHMRKSYIKPVPPTVRDGAAQWRDDASDKPNQHNRNALPPMQHQHQGNR